MGYDLQIENKKVFVTGGGGFIGTNLVNVLSRNNKVTIFDNFYRSAAPNSKFHDTNVNIIHGDVLDNKSLRTALRGHDTIIHCAGVAGINTVGKSPVTTMKVNIQGTFNLFEAIINVAPECERSPFSQAKSLAIKLYKQPMRTMRQYQLLGKVVGLTRQEPAEELLAPHIS